MQYLKWTALVILIALVSYLFFVRPYQVDLHVGEPAPDFSLSTWEEKKISLHDFQGHVVLVNFWATWCPPCVAEIPSLNALSLHFKDAKFVVLGINEDGLHAREEIAKFIERMPISFPILLDGRMEVSDSYGAHLLPTSFIIDQDGVVVDFVQGEVDWMDVKYINLISDLLKQD